LTAAFSGPIVAWITKEKRVDETPKVLVGQQEAAQTRTLSPGLPWQLLGLAGLAFVAVGFADLALTWVPLRVGSPEWEFATMTQTLNGMPVPALGVVTLMAAAAAAQLRWLVRIGAVLMVLLALLLLAGGVLYLLTVPLGLRSVTDPMALLGLKKAMAKSLVQLLVYPALFLTIAVAGWRSTAAITSRKGKP
jgi:hypothetical protein